MKWKPEAGPDEIGLTGGEPFMNPDIIPIMDEIMARGFKLLVLTNAMRPMAKLKDKLLQLQIRYPGLIIGVSVDHYRPELQARSGALNPGSQCWMDCAGFDQGFNLDVAGTLWGDDEDSVQRGFAELFEQHSIAVDPMDKKRLVLFPEMAAEKAVPEITTACWKILILARTQ